VRATNETDATAKAIGTASELSVGQHQRLRRLNVVVTNTASVGQGASVDNDHCVGRHRGG
jgi:hypothetical protein